MTTPQDPTPTDSRLDKVLDYLSRWGSIFFVLIFYIIGMTWWMDFGKEQGFNGMVMMAGILLPSLALISFAAMGSKGV